MSLIASGSCVPPGRGDVERIEMKSETVRAITRSGLYIALDQYSQDDSGTKWGDTLRSTEFQVSSGEWQVMSDGRCIDGGRSATGQ
jgi:hypothetical protein